MPRRSTWEKSHPACAAAAREAVDAVRAEHEARRQCEHEPIPDTYACQACGRRDGLDAVVSDEVWEQIRGGLNLLCLWCIDCRCAEAGIQTSASLHFDGRAITGTSQSDADQEHVSRLVTQVNAVRAEKDREIERLSLIADSMARWLEDAYIDCDAGNHDGGSPKTCEHCIVQGMVKEADAAIAASELPSD